jgi:hypothetical protein
MLPLHDPRWKELNHRGWGNGARSEHDPDAPFVPDELARLLADPARVDRFGSLWPYLCSEGTAWAAAYAAVPYAVELARQVVPEKRTEYLYFVGLVIMCSCPQAGPSFVIHPYLVNDYQQGLADALPLLAETLICQQDATDTRYLLAAAAALKGHPKLGTALNYLECICGKCPRCGEIVYPEELQKID